MSGIPSPDKICPHCGKAAGRGGKVPSHALAAVVLMSAAVIFAALGRDRAASASGGAEAPVGPSVGRLSAAAMEYIASPEADKACGGCLAAADGFLEGKKQAVLREKTKGMVYIPAGDYQRGSPEGAGDPDERPLRQVRLEAFYIEKTEVTTGEYMKFAEETRSNYPEWSKPGGKFNLNTGSEAYYKPLAGVLPNCPACPVVGVPVKDAEAYCRAKGRRLPTEAEWEAAARGGAASAFSFGEDPSRAGDYAWYEGNSGGRPQPVGGRGPNKFGLFDMHGNVWEWVSDRYDRGYYADSPRRDPPGPAAGNENVIRGGSWAFDADSMRSANRASTYKANDDIGFRCAVSESAVRDWN